MSCSKAIAELMPVTTYLGSAIQEPLAAGELTVLLEELKYTTGQEWLIREISIERRKFFFKKTIDYQLVQHR
jgi:hypothetical protein